MKLSVLLICMLISFILTVLISRKAIPWLHKLKFGQTILEEGPSWHKSKQGTPTMGGIAFIISVTFVSVIAVVLNAVFDNPFKISGELYTKICAGLILAVLLGFVGFMDDYIKVKKKQNLGLNIKQKTLMQMLVIAGYLASLYLSMGRSPYMKIPFFGEVRYNIMFWILGVCVIYGTINAVNFTDGIDGLCSSVTMTCGFGFLCTALLNKYFGVGIPAAALIGGSAGFLVYNRHPAKVFMGDTGSMFLGGMVVALAYAVDCPLVLVLMGVTYMLEALSDVIQIGYFKLTHGKRIFKMAPIHHHFEMCGWNENKIDVVFSLVNLLGVTAAVIIMYLGLSK